MIRINLLPFRAARKKEDIRRQITFSGLVVALLVVVMVYTFMQLSMKINSLEREKKELNAKLRELEKTVKKINELEKKIAQIKSKLKVIKTLEKQKTGPVHLLDEIANAVPREKLWLTSLREKGGTLNLSGTAMDNETVALFMTNLEKSKYIKAVDLNKTRSRYIKKYKLTVSDFSLNCRTYAHKAKKKTADKKGKKATRRKR